MRSSGRRPRLHLLWPYCCYSYSPVPSLQLVRTARLAKLHLEDYTTGTIAGIVVASVASVVIIMVGSVVNALLRTRTFSSLTV